MLVEALPMVVKGRSVILVFTCRKFTTTNLFTINEIQSSSPKTVNYKHCPKPHENYEQHEISMIIVTDTIEQPSWSACQGNNKI